MPGHRREVLRLIRNSESTKNLPFVKVFFIFPLYNGSGKVHSGREAGLWRASVNCGAIILPSRPPLRWGLTAPTLDSSPNPPQRSSVPLKCFSRSMPGRKTCRGLFCGISVQPRASAFSGEEEPAFLPRREQALCFRSGFLGSPSPKGALRTFVEGKGANE